MSLKIQPRKIAGWEFFEKRYYDQTAAETLPAEAGEVEGWFIEALKGCRRVLDVGCGAGWPGVYVATQVGELVGIDASPKAIAAARRIASSISNMSFEVGGIEGLPHGDGEFDGAMLCGLLESMDWDAVHRMMPEVRRVLSPDGRVAVLDQDWLDFISRNPLMTTSIRLRKGQLMLQVVERSLSPHTEIDARYIIDPNSLTGREMLTWLGGRERIPTSMKPDDLDPADIISAEYDVAAQFDADSLADLFASYGFRSISSSSRLVPAWGQKVTFLTAIR